MQKVLKTYLRRLTNLTASNRSLVLLRLFSNQFIDVHDFDFAVNKPSFDIIEALMGRKQVIKICTVNDPRDNVSNDLSKKVRKLARFEKFIFEEQGSRDLYVGWPFVHGKFSDGTIVRCPLLFFPVEIESVSNEWVLRQREEVNVTFNKSFLLAYSFFNNVKLEDDLLDRVFDDFDTDSTVFRTALYQVLKDSPIEINFNPGTFSNQLLPFASIRKSEFEESTRNGEIKVMQEAVIGIFPQAGSQLVPDYLHMLEHTEDKDMESFFIREKETKSGNAIREEKVITPYDLDAHQEEAIHLVSQGESLVVQGPPGTGKSQLICNLISDAIASGKRILLVSQKRAALDVVYSRLKEKEIAPFIGLIHDFKNDRKYIYSQISDQIEKIDDYRRRNNGLDIIQLERSFQTSSRTIDRLAEEFRDYKFALFNEDECGISVKELYLTSSREEPVINLKGEYGTLKFDDLQPFVKNISEYFNYYHRFSQENYVLGKRKSFHSFGIQDLKSMQEYLEEMPKLQDRISTHISKITGKSMELEECMLLRDRKETLRSMFEILKEDDVYRNFQNLVKYGDSDSNVLYLSTLERVVLDCFKSEGIETSLPSSELGKFQEALERAIVARKTIFGFLKWTLFSKDKFLLKRVLVANKLKRNKKGVRILEERIDNRLNLEHNLTLLRERPWIQNVPNDYNKVTLQDWFHTWIEAVKAREIFYSVRNFKEYFPVSSFHFDEFYEKVDLLFDAIEEVPPRMYLWLQFFSQSQISSIIGETSFAELMSSTLQMDFDILCEFDKMVYSFNSKQQSVLNKIYDHQPDITPQNAVSLFQNSLRITWIDHIETKYPILRYTASGKFQKMVEEIQQAVEEKQRTSKEILLLKARERSYEYAEFNRLKNMVTYRDLHHQTTKKRRIWPLRKLMANHHGELFNLIPCWLSSPESVSAVFPMMKVFDLVIFDEASQCFSERGLPAIYRGKQTVIAGDSKQLRPNDLYQVRWEDEDSDDPVLDVDSLLELAAPYLRSVQLRGHYRSKSMDLIDFSNKQFYKSQLFMLPDKEVMDRQEPAIQYVKVDGIWESNVNEIEAEKVISIISDLFLTSPDLTVGVVTFNAKQQNLIMDMIDTVRDSGMQIPDHLFVKNIENVQGDERDIIVFSTAYAKDKMGKLRMQFGSLNAEGGENRLNVAITRAREKIIIVSSIFPSQLKVEELKNEGPKLLKKYLFYAKEVSEGKFKPTINSATTHDVDWYLKYKLSEQKSNGFSLVSEMPFADLTVKEGNKPIGLLLTDDDLYFQSSSPKEDFVYTPSMLKLKNWKFLSLHSREFWLNPQAVEEKMKQFNYKVSVKGD